MNVAITGHRPQGLEGRTRDVIDELSRAMVARCIERWPDQTITFHTGAAIGIDLMVALQVIGMGVGHRLHPPLVEPVIYTQRDWDHTDIEHYQWVRDHSDRVCPTCPQDRISAAGYQRRNVHMVDSSQLLIAFWNGKPGGGTWNCIRYARSVDVPVLNALDGFKRIA